MSYIELTINAAAIVTFLWLTYKLSLLAFSLPINMARVNKIKVKLSEANCALIEKSGNKIQLNQLLESLQDASFKLNECPINMLKQFAKSWNKGQPDIANARVDAWFESVGRNYDRQYSLASFAMDWGIFYTVVACLTAFAHIGSSADPFAAFASLATAALTTAAGLAIKMIVTFLLNKFEKKMESLGQVAAETLFALAEITTARNKNVISSPPKSDRWKTSPDHQPSQSHSPHFLKEPPRADQSVYRHPADPLLEIKDIGRRPVDHQNGKSKESA